ALNYLPENERPDIILLYRDEDSFLIASRHQNLVTDIRSFNEAADLNLDIVYPVTQIYETPLNTPWAAWIPDWQHKHMPEMFNEVEILRRDEHYRLLATKAPILCFSSQWAYDDTVKIVDNGIAPLYKLNFPAVIEEKDLFFDKDNIDETLKKYNIQRKFFITCNKLWKHKNHIIVLKALKKLSDPSILGVFTGDVEDERWPDHVKELNEYIKVNDLSSSVLFLSQIPRRDQLTLIAAAKAVIQPSQCEGWSTIVEEAKALKKKLILSDFPVHLEQAPGAMFFDPLDENKLAELIDKIHKNKSYTNHHSANQKVLKSYKENISHCARNFLNFTRTLGQLYEPQKHDSIGIISNFIAQLNLNSESETEIAFIQQEFSRVVGYLRNQSLSTVFKFMEIVYEKVPVHLDIFKNKILLPVLFPKHPFATEVSALQNLLKSTLEDSDKRLKLIHKLEKDATKLREERIEEIRLLQQKSQDRLSIVKNHLNITIADSDKRLKLIHKLEKEVIKLREDRIEQLKKYESENNTYIEVIKKKEEEIKLLQQKSQDRLSIVKNHLNITIADSDKRLKLIHKLDKEVIRLREDRIKQLKKIKSENNTFIEVIKKKENEIKLLQQKNQDRLSIIDEKIKDISLLTQDIEYWKREANKGIISQIIKKLRYKISLEFNS
ncbi:glycosyltransferase, partial [Thermodesulfobacteriota bacterium]